MENVPVVNIQHVPIDISNNIVKACPECGVLWKYNCYHDGMEVDTVRMTVQKAILLLEDEIRNKEDSLETCKTLLTNLKSKETT